MVKKSSKSATAKKSKSAPKAKATTAKVSFVNELRSAARASAAKRTKK